MNAVNCPHPVLNNYVGTRREKYMLSRFISSSLN